MSFGASQRSEPKGNILRGKWVREGRRGFDSLPQQYKDPAGMRPQNMYMAPVHHLAAPRTLSPWTVPDYPDGMIFKEDGYETYEDPSVPGPSSRIQARSMDLSAAVSQNRAPMAPVNHFAL